MMMMMMMEEEEEEKAEEVSAHPPTPHPYGVFGSSAI